MKVLVLCSECFSVVLVLFCKTASSYTVFPAALESGLRCFELSLCGLRKHRRDGLKSAATAFICISGHNFA